MGFPNFPPLPEIERVPTGTTKGAYIEAVQTSIQNNMDSEILRDLLILAGESSENIRAHLQNHRRACRDRLIEDYGWDPH